MDDHSNVPILGQARQRWSAFSLSRVLTPAAQAFCKPAKPGELFDLNRLRETRTPVL